MGIPYAKPPIGAHRFNYTEPIEPWNGVFEADKHVACLQVSKFKDRKEMLGNKQVDLIILLEEPTTLANQFSQLVQSGT